MTSAHHFKFSQQTPDEQNDAGLRIKADKNCFPVLKGMSLYKIVLKPNGIREPHWHANADELGYCLQGQALINLYHTGDTKATFLVQQGDVFFIPSGALHDIENVGKEDLKVILSFSSETTEDFGITGTLGAFTNAVLGNTWGVKGDVFQPLKRTTENIFFSFRKTPVVIPDESRYGTPFRFNLGGSQPFLTNEGGFAQIARQNVWPKIQHQALYSLTLTGQGMREPHWHPETAELGYVEKGKGRMSILSPSGKVDTYAMDEGDIYFIPKAYPHHIENMSDDKLHILIFFDQGMPGDVGFTGSIRSFSDQVLGSVTSTDSTFFSQLKKDYFDAFIVKKVNPLDP